MWNTKVVIPPPAYNVTNTTDDEFEKDKALLHKYNYVKSDLTNLISVIRKNYHIGIQDKYGLEDKYITRIINFLCDLYYNDIVTFMALCNREEDYNKVSDDGIGRITNEYYRFKKLVGNRGKGDDDTILSEESKGHVKGLMQSILQIGWQPIPILVNENYEIVEGQHRYMALEILSLPIQYGMRMGIGDKQCNILNAHSKNWSTEDYIQGKASKGVTSYILLQQLLEKYRHKYNLNVIGVVLSNVEYSSGMIRSKNFFLTEDMVKQKQYKFDLLDEVSIVLDELNSLLKHRGVLQRSGTSTGVGGRTETLLEAIALLDEYIDYDKEHLLKSLRLHLADDMYRARWSDVRSATLILNDIYNEEIRYKKDKLPIFIKYQDWVFNRTNN